MTPQICSLTSARMLWRVLSPITHSSWFIHGERCCLLRLLVLTVSCPKDVSPWLFFTQCLCLHLDFNLNVVSSQSLAPAGVSLFCILCLYEPVAFVRSQLSVSGSCYTHLCVSCRCSITEQYRNKGGSISLPCLL